MNKNGIKRPKPHLICGSLKDYNSKNIHQFEEWFKIYGNIFGFYLGDKACVATLEEFISVITVKDLHFFKNRFLIKSPYHFINDPREHNSITIAKEKTGKNIERLQEHHLVQAN